MMSRLLFVVAIIEILGVFGYNNGEAMRPALGWNTWCSIEGCGTDVCNENEVQQVAQAMLSNGMYEAGWDRINLDDCWEACTRTSNNEIQPDPERFPNGIKWLTQTLHGMGFKFGLYTSAGSTTCSGGTRANCHPPGSYGYYTQDAKTFAEWEVDYVKMDWCGSDLTNSTKQHTEFSQALNSTGRHIWLELCRGYGYPPPPYVAEVANSWRITGDHHDDWDSTRNAIGRSAGCTNMSAVYNWAYNDFLMTGGQGCKGDSNANFTHPHCPGMTDNEYMTEFSMWSIIGSPLLVATDVRNMTNIMKKVLLNKDIIAVNQVNNYPAGDIVQGLTTDCDKNVSNACQVWSRQIASNSYAIVLYNAGEKSYDITVQFKDINANFKGKDIELKDLWENKILGYWVNSYSNNIMPHSVQFLTATEQ